MSSPSGQFAPVISIARLSKTLFLISWPLRLSDVCFALSARDKIPWRVLHEFEALSMSATPSAPSIDSAILFSLRASISEMDVACSTTHLTASWFFEITSSLSLPAIFRMYPPTSALFACWSILKRNFSIFSCGIGSVPSRDNGDAPPMRSRP